MRLIHRNLLSSDEAYLLLGCVKRLLCGLPAGAQFLGLVRFQNPKNKCMKKWILRTGVCLTALAACSKDDGRGNEANDTDRNFVTMAALSNNAEVGAGQVAATKGTNALVKAFGQQMATEHTTAQTDLKNRASALGLTAPDTVDAEHKALAARLNTLSGYSFDTAYMNAQIKDHAKTLDVFKTEISGGNNQSIHGFAADYLPHIQMHYNKADSIRKLL